MAAVSGNAVVVPVEPMPLTVGCVRGSEALQHWFVDERDGFISWLRGEFVAANAIIDLLMDHLRVTGEPGEYDHVVGSIHQRRFHWTYFLHMQQFFPVADVGYALQQVVDLRQLKQRQRQRQLYGQKEKDGRKFGFGHRSGHLSDGARESRVSPVSGTVASEDGKVEQMEHKVGPNKNVNQNNVQMSQAIDSLPLAEKDENSHRPVENYCMKDGNRPADVIKLEAATVSHSQDSDFGDNTIMTSNQARIQKVISASKEFVAKETCDGMMVNVVEGLKLYEDFLDSSEVTKLVLLANEMRAAGHRGELSGQTFVTLKRPMKGHGREMIQLGMLTNEGSIEDEHRTLSSEVTWGCFVGRDFSRNFRGERVWIFCYVSELEDLEMAAVSGNAVVVPVEPMPLTVGCVRGSEALQHWFVDERDGFISWLRGEFVAANAIIDLLMDHLRVTGEPGEYDHVVGSIHQRRFHWTYFLHMQQFFPVADVGYALQQVVDLRQLKQRQRQRQLYGQKEKDGRKFGFGHRSGHLSDGARESRVSPVSGTVASEDGKVEQMEHKVGPNKNVNQNNVQMSQAIDSLPLAEKDENSHRPVENYCMKDGNRPADVIKLEAATVSHSQDSDFGDNTIMTSNQARIQKVISASKEFVAKETCDGMMVNVVEGLKLYEDFLDSSEVTKLVLLANEMRAAGHRGELSGQTFVTLKRPMKGHGREMIQLGMLTNEGSIEDEHRTLSSEERKIEAIPSILCSVFDCLFEMQVLPVKPDFCVIDFFNEGDYSQPHSWPSWFGRPICNLFLSDCDIVYGKAVGSNHKGDYDGSLKLPITAGSLVLMQGKSADLAKRAIPSLHKKQILLTFGKHQPKKTLLPSEGLFSTSYDANPVSIPTSVRPSNFFRYPSAHKPFGMMPANGVLHKQQGQQNMPPPTVVQPLFAAAPTVASLALPAMPPTTIGWTTAAPPRHPAGPRPPVPGTGVFLPPGSTHTYATQQLPVPPISAQGINDNGSEKPVSSSNAASSNSSQNIITTILSGPDPERNGCLGTASAVSNHEHHNSVDKS
ncbi:uncharacterized protein LOC141811538 [Curcuma longa]|uniref:uncharacterized protein LOC141811538 n=1 Tax=Curcuma longa TaxID=136217 RepID=UPI003D9E6F5F